MSTKLRTQVRTTATPPRRARPPRVKEPTAPAGHRKAQERRPTVLIADADPLAARVVRDALREGARFAIPGVAKDGREAVELARHYRPDLALVEIALPELDGLTTIRRIAEVAPEVRVVVFSQHDREDVQLDALRAGAVGFISKRAGVDRLPHALKAVIEGEAAISRRLTMRIVDLLRMLPDNGIGIRPVRSNLTPREWEVLDLISQGKDTREIADDLILSEDTIYSHVKSLLRKLGVHSRKEAVEVAKKLREPLVGLAGAPPREQVSQ
jgi:two-component system, NarL family, response regulator LiaR